MTRMIPPTIHSSMKSRAERRFYEIIRDAERTDHWVCLHSLGLAQHERKRRAEIDFVLLTHHGVFALEIKGGRISRRHGVWHSEGRDGEHDLDESPFDQASSAMFALEKHVREHFRGKPLGRTLFGYGVVMPDVRFEDPGPESDPRCVFDRRDLQRPLTAYVERLAEFARQSDPRPRNALNNARIGELADFLRGDFDLVPTMEVTLADIGAQLAKLTREQRAVLDDIDQCPRLLVDGGAGTGKTLLAIEAARRRAREGQRVLFLTYNKLLAARLSTGVAIEDYAGELVIRNVHRHFYELIEASPLADELTEKFDPDDKESFDVLLPELAELAAADAPEGRFDALVLDEAQDLLTMRNLEALAQMLHGGLEQGRWYAFLDSQDQALMYARAERAAFERLRQYGVSHRLFINCRNTRPIARQTALLSGSRRRSEARIGGPPVEYIPYQEHSGWGGNLERVLHELRREWVSPGRVSVLLTRRPNAREAKVLARLGIEPLDDETVTRLGSSALPRITWSTASGFKGLENDAVILVGVDNVEKEWFRSVIYVGMSRARTRLYVILSDACDEERQRRLQARRAEREQRSSDVEMLL